MSACLGDYNATIQGGGEFLHGVDCTPLPVDFLHSGYLHDNLVFAPELPVAMPTRQFFAVSIPFPVAQTTAAPDAISDRYRLGVSSWAFVEFERACGELYGEPCPPGLRLRAFLPSGQRHVLMRGSSPHCITVRGPSACCWRSTRRAWNACLRSTGTGSRTQTARSHACVDRDVVKVVIVLGRRH